MTTVLYYIKWELQCFGLIFTLRFSQLVNVGSPFPETEGQLGLESVHTGKGVPQILLFIHAAALIACWVLTHVMTRASTTSKIPCRFIDAFFLRFLCLFSSSTRQNFYRFLISAFLKFMQLETCEYGPYLSFELMSYLKPGPYI